MKKLFNRFLLLLLALVFSLSSLFACNNQNSENDEQVIKNVIFMIPDGGGFDNFTLADQVKRQIFAEGKNKLDGARTTLSKDTLSSYGFNDVTGLYLNEFLVGAVNTLSYDDDNPNEFDTTDSSAAGTALATGHKTVYGYAGIDKTRTPIASITELAQTKEKATGIVTTKSFVDATPLAFYSGHSIYRREYQDVSLQALTSGLDVVIAEGTEYGDILSEGEQSSHPDVSASKLGYTLARTKDEMFSAVNSGAKKLWASISGMNHNKNTPTQVDNSTNVIAYDVESSSTNPTLLEMTQSAIKALENANNENGFFLMVEGGALDNAAEGGLLRYAMGEALAFDETFAYCVKWAKEHGDNTLVVAVADHDSGGFSGIENYKQALIDLIIKGENKNGKVVKDTTFKDYAKLINGEADMKLEEGHTKMPVPLSIYLPDFAKSQALELLGLPLVNDGVRYPDKPQYYSLESVKSEYLIENTKIAPMIANLVQLGSLDELSSEMFVEVARYSKGKPSSSFKQLGTLTFSNKNVKGAYVYQDVTFTSNDGSLVVNRNSFEGKLNGNTTALGKIGNKQFRALYILRDNSNYLNDLNYQTGSFFLPKSILQQAGIIA